MILIFCNFILYKHNVFQSILGIRVPGGDIVVNLTTSSWYIKKKTKRKKTLFFGLRTKMSVGHIPKKEVDLFCENMVSAHGCTMKCAF